MPIKPKPKIYVAASYPRKHDAAGLANWLRSRGFTTTSTWHHGNTADNPALWRGDSCVYWGNIQECNALVCLTGDNLSKGGRHTELGIAIGMDKRVIIFGPVEQVFHKLPGVVQVNSHKDLLEAIRKGGAL